MKKSHKPAMAMKERGHGHSGRKPPPSSQSKSMAMKGKSHGKMTKQDYPDSGD